MTRRPLALAMGLGGTQAMRGYRHWYRPRRPHPPPVITLPVLGCLRVHLVGAVLGRRGRMRMGWKMAVSMVSVPSNGMSEPRAVLFYLSLDTYINIALDMLVVIGSVSLLQSHTSTSLHVRMPYPRSSRSCNTPGGLTYRTRARGSRAPAATLNERSRRKPATEFECTSPWNVPSPYTFALELPTRPACVFRLFNSCCRAKLTFHCPRCVPHPGSQIHRRWRDSQRNHI